VKNLKTIGISEELYNRIADIAAKHDETTDAMAGYMLNSQVEKVLKEAVFYPGTKFFVDPKAVIQAKMFASDVVRLQKWQQQPDARIEFLGGANDELIIINRTLAELSKELETITK
jgi:hypothetical protein